MTVLSVKIVLPKVALRARGVGTLESFMLSLEASAAVTLIEIMLSSCSGVVGISVIRILFVKGCVYNAFATMS